MHAMYHAWPMVVSALSFIFCSAIATAGTYSLSAHGNSETGVKRTQGPFPPPDIYAIGNCAHCHEQHASIDDLEPGPDDGGPSSFALFAPTFDTSKITASSDYQQSDLFCFYCHTDNGSYQANNGSMINKDYAETFGGHINGPTSIMGQFNQIDSGGSNHNLYDIWNYMKEHPEYGKKNGGWFTENSDPCTACHNPHLARQNKEHLTDASYATISLPSDHYDQWGDDEFEQMSDYSSIYQAPFYAYSGSHPSDIYSATYEPAGVGYSQADGQLTPDYNTFCLDCHCDSIYSSTQNRNLSVINWDTERHGIPDAYEVFSRTPFGVLGGYVLSCLDCHEPHGSSNNFLIRRGINGQDVGAVGVVAGDRGNQCRQCHMDDYAYAQGAINDWKYSHHGRGQLSPYSAMMVGGCGCHDYNQDGAHSAPDPIPCERCHYHGSFVPNPAGEFPSTLTPKNEPYYRKMF
nr:cytochrome c3 family protein [uncultured Desulfuromonas sp.]